MMRTIRRFVAVCLSTAILAAASMNSMAQNSHTLPLVLPASNAALTGFVRIINNSFQPGTVSITAIDDTGERHGPITLNLESEQTINFNSRDLENGNAAKGLSVGVGEGSGSWRLILDSELGITPLAYIRTSDGFVTSMHDVTPETIVFFNPGSNNRQISRLRLINPGTSPAEIEITGRDDAGESAPGGEVRLTLAAGESRTLTAQDLESGGEGITGRLGEGTGKWQLSVSSNVAIDAVSLLQSPTGHLANLSTTPESNDPLTLPLVLPATESALTGFVRIINRSDQTGSVRITAIDDTGDRHGPITLNLESNETVNFNSRDLEQGNAAKGLYGGVGNGEGNWRLEFDSTLDVSTLAYIRTSDGFVTGMHDVAPSTDRIHRVRFFNPGSNNRQISRLRLNNPGTAPARVEITGRDDAGDTAPGGTVGLTLAAGESRTLTAQALESGGEGITGSLGDGAGKWQLTISANRDIDVMSLLQSPTGHLANLSTSPSEDAPASFANAEPISLDGGMITGQLDSPDDTDLYSVTVDETIIMDLSGSNNIIITVFDEQGNVIAQSYTTTAGEGEGGAEYNIVVKGAIGVLRAGKRYFVRVAKNPRSLRRDYQLVKAAVKFALRKVRNFVRRDVMYGDGDVSIDVAEFFTGESDAIMGDITYVPFSTNIPPSSLNPWAKLSIIEFTSDHALRIKQDTTSVCGTDFDYSAEVKIKLVLSWEQRLPGGDTKTYSGDFGEFPITMNRQSAPRRVGNTRQTIAASVAAGATENVTLTDYIVDPDGGSLTFKVAFASVPRGWGAAIRGNNLVLVPQSGAVDGTLIVTATDSDGECWDFPVSVSVGEGGGGGGLCCDFETHTSGEVIRGCQCHPDAQSGEEVCPPDNFQGIRTVNKRIVDVCPSYAGCCDYPPVGMCVCIGGSVGSVGCSASGGVVVSSCPQRGTASFSIGGIPESSGRNTADFFKLLDGRNE